MNTLEKKMVELLVNLKTWHHVIAVKAEFEAEAARTNEVMRLKDVANKAGLGLVLKIGGGEAIMDMYTAEHIGVDLLVAPMIESGYAAKKYLDAVEAHFSEDTRKHMEFGITIETIQAFKNFDDILRLPKIELLNAITLGRTDMCGSLGMSKYDVNENKIYLMAESIFKRAKKKGLRTTVGGGMDPKSKNFIENLVKKRLLDRFEARKIVFETAGQDFSNLKEGIDKANKFEYLWLSSKRQHYSSIYFEDVARMKMLKERLAKQREN
jgi:hypothetical protein